MADIRLSSVDSPTAGLFDTINDCIGTIFVLNVADNVMDLGKVNC